MLASCVSDQEQLQKSLPQVNHAQFTIPSLPRKFNLKEEVKSAADKDFVPRAKPMDSSSGNRLHPKEQNLIHAARGTWREWVEGANKSEYYTMDYSWVRRRRPIHNKQVPVAP
ncbi:Hypothetical predicted protein [Olea europaea subsp. europaea]|uniref:Uncharacterized protein n=1 Tax=Olea europaea subsp. europaea TaxID=158383 RepID=A0A8S0RDL4_OLEEU|nr:Hypothetical predicted protein [Olea europaea subsp. europaea]